MFMFCSTFGKHVASIKLSYLSEEEHNILLFPTLAPNAPTYLCTLYSFYPRDPHLNNLLLSLAENI